MQIVYSLQDYYLLFNIIEYHKLYCIFMQSFFIVTQLLTDIGKC